MVQFSEAFNILDLIVYIMIIKKDNSWTCQDIFSLVLQLYIDVCLNLSEKLCHSTCSSNCGH